MPRASQRRPCWRRTPPRPGRRSACRPSPSPPTTYRPPEKVALGDKLFDDKRFSSTGQVACATCHDAKKAFTDSPLRVSDGIKKAGKARNAPTVVNAAYFDV